MGCLTSSFSLGDAVIVHDGWGEVLFEGVIVDTELAPYSYVVSNGAGRTSLVSVSGLSGVGKMTDDPIAEAVAGMPRDMLETEYRQVLAKLAVMSTEIDGATKAMQRHGFMTLTASQCIDALAAEQNALAEVVAMQCEALASAPAATTNPPTKVVRRAILSGLTAEGEDGNEWFDKLVDLTELYLVRQLGERHPVRIADEDLRRLVSHILD